MTKILVTSHDGVDREVPPSLCDQESGWTDHSSSNPVDKKHARTVNNSKTATASSSSTAASRTSRVISWLIGMAILAVAVLGVWFFMDRKGYGIQESRHENYQGLVSQSQLQAHHEAADCWMEIHGNVYDLTTYAPRHPGGAEYVTDYCGMNATRFYDLEHPVRYLQTIKQYNLGVAVTDEEYNALQQQQQSSSEFDRNGGVPSDTVDEDSSSYDDSEDSSSYDDLEDDSDDKDETDPTVNDSLPTPAPIASTATANPAIPQGYCPVQYYSTATVAQHSLREDCWYILYNRVYDFTTYVDAHPGGARRVFEHCGTNATIPYMVERKHDIDLLDKETPEILIGYWSGVTGIQYEPCSEG